MQRFAGAHVFLTGGTGFIGGVLARRLVEEGARVTVLARRPERARRLRELGVDVREGDVTEPASIDLRDQDLVIHAAAWVAMGIPRAKRRLFWDTNVEGTANVLEAARRADVPKVVHVSSIAALARAAARPGHAASEADYDPRPATYASFYERTKVEAHRLADESGLHVAMPMPAIVLGPGGPFDVLFRRFATGRLPALPKGDAVKGWVHVEDAAEGVLLAALKGSGPYLLVDDCVKTSELFARLAHVVGVRAPTRRVHVRTIAAVAAVVEGAYHAAGKVPPLSSELVRGLREPMRYDSSRARKELGWAPDMWPRVAADVRAMKPKAPPKGKRKRAPRPKAT